MADRVKTLPPPQPTQSRTMTANNSNQSLKDAVIRARGYWHAFHDGLLELDPGYLRTYLDFQDAPARSGTLDPKVHEFIYIAVDGAVSHLYTPGLGRHIEMALAKGATPGEVLEVIQLTMLTTLDSFDAGLGVLAAELERRGQTLAAPEGLEDRSKAHVALTGGWPRFADALAAVAPHLLDPVLAYEAAPYAGGHLTPKLREFIRIAIHASPVAPQREALARDIPRALDEGASPAEIAEVLALASAIAVHTCTFAIPALHQAMRSGAPETPPEAAEQ